MENNEIKRLIPIIEEKLSSLIILCQQQLQAGFVSLKIRDNVEGILLQERRTLDKIIRSYFEKNIFSINKLHNTSKTFFPFCDKQSELDAVYKKIKIDSLKTFDPKLYSLINKYQPYNSRYGWIKDLQTYSNLSHNVLIAVTKKDSLDEIHIGGVHIFSPNMHLRYVQINNILIRELITKNGEIVSADLDDEIKNILNIKHKYYIQGTKINVLLLCKQGLELIKELIQDFL